MPGPTPQQIDRFLHLANRAPSGDNVQPWRFEWDGQALAIFFRPSLARHVLDAGHSASAIALGCLLQSLEMAAGADGFAVQFEFRGLGEKEETCALVQFTPAAPSTESWVEWLPKRTTDRRPYQKGPIPDEALRETVKGFDRSDLAKVYWVNSISKELMEYLIATESLVTVHSSIFRDTLPWIRMSRREVERTKDGMPWRGTGVGISDYPVLSFLQAFPRSFPLFSRLGMQRIYPRRVRRLLESSAGLLCFTTSQPSREALLQIGRLAMRLWLQLTRLGYGVQPMTIASLSVYNAAIGVLDSEIQQQLGARSQGADILRQSFGIPPNEVPVWLLRTGLSSPLPIPWVTLRRS